MFSYLLFTLAIVLTFVGYKFTQLLAFRSETLNVIVCDLQYEPAVPGFQGKAFLDATRLAKLLNGNKYDAAIIFMLTQLASLPTEACTKEFKIEKYALIEEILYLSTQGDQLISQHIKLKSTV